MRVIDFTNYQIQFEETPELKEIVYQKVLNWFLENGTSGEGLLQTDSAIINAPVFMSILADKVFKFKELEC